MYDTTLLAKSTAVSLGVVAVVGMLFLSTGTAFAMPVAGIGGFTITADRIEGQDMVMYPGVSNGGDRAMAVVEMKSNTIYGMQLVKKVDLSQYSGGTMNGTARLVIDSGGTVHADQLLMKTPSINAGNATFSGLEIGDTGPDSNPFQISSPSDPEVQPRTINLTGGQNPGLVMTDAKIHATYLATNQISMPNMSVSVQLDTNGDGQYEMS
ncbi:MAG: DUF6230 family protein [Haloarculaceae archaeon]